jgi:ribosomal protein S18 acetylase RimI-like enzyme
MENVTFNEMRIEDYDEVYALWQATENVGLSSADGRQEIGRFLEANPGLSFTARISGELAGAVLGSTDGRRGYLHHLAVRPQFRRLGVGRVLIERSLQALAARGIRKCHIFVFGGNQEGFRFWEEVGFRRRTDIVIMSKEIGNRD